MKAAVEASGVEKARQDRASAHLDAEKTVLAQFILAPRSATEIIVPLLGDGDAFTGRGHRAIYLAARRLGLACDLPALNHELAGVVEASSLSALLDDPLPHGREVIEHHCRMILAEARRRGLQMAAVALNAALGRSTDADAALQDFNTAIQALPSVEVAAQRPIPYVDLAELAKNGIPSVKWLVDGWLEEKGIALAAGPPGCGKTTTVYGLAMFVASGRDAFGLHVAEPVRVLVVDEEQGCEEAARLLIRLGAPHENIKLLSMAGVCLANSEGRALLLAAMEDWHPTVVVLDSLTQIFAVGNENDAAQVQERFDFLFEIRDKYGVAFILIHHRSKEIPGQARAGIDKPRGSTVYTSMVSTVWLVQPVSREAHDLVQVKRRGARLAPPLRITYADDGPESPIQLTGSWIDEDSETEKVADAVVDYLASRGEESTKAITNAIPRPPQRSLGGHRRLVSRAIKSLVDSDAVTKVRKGIYRLAGEPEGADGLPF